MHWVKENVTLLTEWNLMDKPNARLQNNELFSAMCTGFFFLLRVSEIEGLRMKDVRIAHEDGGSFLTIFIAESKTDQFNQCDFKRLDEAGGTLCPLAAMARYLHLVDWDPLSSLSLFGNDIRGGLTGLLRIAANDNQIEHSRIGTHSLRSGGANAMFVAGYDSGIIKRWGRWVSDSFCFYLRGDDRALASVGKGMVRSTGLLGQLQLQSSRDLMK